MHNFEVHLNESVCRKKGPSWAGTSPKPRGKIMTTHCFVDGNHAADKVTRRSQTGILIFCNRAPILWFSKRQNSVESSTFGSEFTELKNAVELVTAIRYS